MNHQVKNIAIESTNDYRQLVQSPKSLARVGHWKANLSLRYSLRSNESGLRKTVLSERKHFGPYTVQRPFYPEGGICHSILLHPPGGLVEGDALRLNIQCDAGSHALITTPSSGKVYECESDVAAQYQRFNVESGATLEWFPQEMILYQDSKSLLNTEINLAKDAHFAGWEMVCFGRPIAGDHFTLGQLTQHVAINRNGKPLLNERTFIDANPDTTATSTSIKSAQYGLANYVAMGVFIMTGADKQSLELAREAIDSLDESIKAELQIGITLLDDVLIARALINQSRFAKTAFSEIWSELRPIQFGVPACTPRIWAT